MADQNVSSIVDKAVEDVIKANPVGGGDPKPEAIEEKPKESKGDDPKPEVKDSKADDFSEEDLANATQIYKALKAGGESAAFIIDTLATKNGYSRIETKAEAKEAKVEIKNELEEALGDEYSHLAAKLIPAINKFVDRRLTEGTAEINENIKASRQEKLEARSDVAFKDIGDEFYDGKDIPADVDSEMAALMKKYKPGSDQSIEEYVSEMHHLATVKIGKVPMNKASRKAAAQAKANVPAILDSTKGRPITSTEVKPRDKGERMTVDHAVRSAMKEVNEQYEKG
jgi:hypothetical protein